LRLDFHGQMAKLCFLKGVIYIKWYAIFVQTGKEDDVYLRIKRTLEQKKYSNEYKMLIPKRLILERHKGEFVEVETTMFPGYILVNSNDIVKLYQLTKQCKGLYRFLRLESEFQEISQNEISNIINMMDDQGIIGCSDIFVEDDKVKVIAGPLCNYIGKVKKIDKHKRRAKIVFNFQGKEYYIDLSINVICKTTDLNAKATLYMCR